MISSWTNGYIRMRRIISSIVLSTFILSCVGMDTWANDVSFAAKQSCVRKKDDNLSALSRVKPFADIKYKGDGFVVYKGDPGELQLEKDFKNDFELIYVNKLMAKAIETCGSNVGEEVLQKFIKKHISHITSTKFDLKNLHKDGKTFCLPYKKNSSEKELLLRYYLPVDYPEEVSGKISFPVGIGTVRVAIEGMEDFSDSFSWEKNIHKYLPLPDFYAGAESSAQDDLKKENGYQEEAPSYSDIPEKKIKPPSFNTFLKSPIVVKCSILMIVCFLFVNGIACAFNPALKPAGPIMPEQAKIETQIKYVDNGEIKVSAPNPDADKEFISFVNYLRILGYDVDSMAPAGLEGLKWAFNDKKGNAILLSPGFQDFALFLKKQYNLNVMDDLWHYTTDYQFPNTLERYYSERNIEIVKRNKKYFNVIGKGLSFYILEYLDKNGDIDVILEDVCEFYKKIIRQFPGIEKRDSFALVYGCISIVFSRDPFDKEDWNKNIRRENKKRKQILLSKKAREVYACIINNFELNWEGASPGQPLNLFGTELFMWGDSNLQFFADFLIELGKSSAKDLLFLKKYGLSKIDLKVLLEERDPYASFEELREAIRSISRWESVLMDLKSIFEYLFVREDSTEKMLKLAKKKKNQQAYEDFLFQNAEQGFSIDSFEDYLTLLKFLNLPDSKKEKLFKRYEIEGERAVFYSIEDIYEALKTLDSGVLEFHEKIEKKIKKEYPKMQISRFDLAKLKKQRHLSEKITKQRYDIITKDDGYSIKKISSNEFLTYFLSDTGDINTFWDTINSKVFIERIRSFSQTYNLEINFGHLIELYKMFYDDFDDMETILSDPVEGEINEILRTYELQKSNIWRERLLWRILKTYKQNPDLLDELLSERCKKLHKIVNEIDKDVLLRFALDIRAYALISANGGLVLLESRDNLVSKKYLPSNFFAPRPFLEASWNKKLIDKFKNGELMKLSQKIKGCIDFENVAEIDVLIDLNEISDVDKYLKIVKELKGCALNSGDIKRFSFLAKDNDHIYNLTEPLFIDFFRKVTEKYILDTIQIKDIVQISELYTRIRKSKDQEKMMETMFSKQFIENADFLRRDYHIASLESNILGALLNFTMDLDVEAMNKLKSYAGREIYASDILLLNTIAKNKDLKKLFTDRSLLIQIVEEMLAKRPPNFRTRWGMGEKKGYTERPTIQSLDNLTLIRMYILSRALKDPLFIAQVGRIVSADINDKTTEYGGVLLLREDGTLYPNMVRSVYEKDGGYANDLNYFLAGGMNTFHGHALNLDCSEYGGASGLIGEQGGGDFKMAELYNYTGTIFTSMGLENDKTIKVNVDIYYIDKRGEKPIERDIDLGIISAPYDPNTVMYDLFSEELKETLLTNLKRKNADKDDLTTVRNIIEQLNGLVYTDEKERVIERPEIDSMRKIAKKYNISLVFEEFIKHGRDHEEAHLTVRKYMRSGEITAKDVIKIVGDKFLNEDFVKSFPFLEGKTSAYRTEELLAKAISNSKLRDKLKHPGIKKWETKLMAYLEKVKIKTMEKERVAKEIIPVDKKTTEEQIFSAEQEKIVQKFIDAIYLKALMTPGERIMIAVDTSLIPNVQRAAIQGLLNRLERMPLNNIVVVRNEGAKLASDILEKANVKKTKTKISNIIVLGREKVIKSPAFDFLRSTPAQKKAVLAFIDKVCTNNENYEYSNLRVLEILTEMMNIVREDSTEMDNDLMSIKDEGYRSFRIMLKKIKPIDLQILKDIYNAQCKILTSV